MEKLNEFLKGVKKYGFWVTCGAVLLAGIVCWWWATSGLATEFETRKSTLDGKFKAVQIQSNHPNSAVIAKIKDLHNQLQTGVDGAWDVMYQQQQQYKQLPSVLDEQFKKEFLSLKEKGELSNSSREQYRNYIKRDLPRLLEAGNIRRLAQEGKEKSKPGKPGTAATARGSGQLAGQSGGAADGQQLVGIVDWDAADYKTLETRLVWPQDPPSTMAILLAQEDLWVYEAVLRIIKNTNEGASDNTTAAVRRIESLRIGKSASQGGNVSAGVSAGEHDIFAIKQKSSRRDKPAGSDIQQLMEGRYVDEKNQALSATAEYPYVVQPSPEFKRIPIQMRLVVDQEKLPALLVECANSTMPIDVGRVSIGKGAGAQSLFGGADTNSGGPGPGGGPMGGPGGPMGGPGGPMGGPMGKPMGGLGPMGGSGGPMGGPMGKPMGGLGQMGGGGLGAKFGAAAGAESGARVTTLIDTSYVPVQIDGVMYIYNSPNRGKPATGTSSAKKSDGAPASAPVAMPDTRNSRPAKS